MPKVYDPTTDTFTQIDQEVYDRAQSAILTIGQIQPALTAALKDAQAGRQIRVEHPSWITVFGVVRSAEESADLLKQFIKELKKAAFAAGALPLMPAGVDFGYSQDAIRVIFQGSVQKGPYEMCMRIDTVMTHAFAL